MSAAAPVLALFRRVMRLHRRVLAPPALREMGDRYCRDEFSRHLKADTTPAQWQAFMAEWSRYCEAIGGPAGAAPGGGGVSGDLPEELAHSLAPDQRARLERLRLEASLLGRDLLRGAGGTPRE